MTNKIEKRVILLNGASSSGKTSLARRLQSLSPEPMLHASLDTFVDMFRWDAIPNEQMRKACHAVGVANFHRTLPLLVSGGYPVVVDHIFENSDWYAATRAALEGCTVCFVGLHCSLSVLEEREQSRGDRRIGMARWQWERVHEGKPYDLELDTSEMTVDEEARQILSYVGL